MLVEGSIALVAMLLLVSDRCDDGSWPFFKVFALRSMIILGCFISEAEQSFSSKRFVKRSTSRRSQLLHSI